VKIHNITGTIDVKRFYLPGLEISRPCATCGATLTWDDNDYVSYPKLGEPLMLYLFCYECNKGTYVEAEMNITITEK
jgi:hypothetical protein